MNEENKNIIEAKKTLKSTMKFLEMLYDNLDSEKTELKVKAIVSSWCIFDYCDKNLLNDVQTMINEIIKTEVAH